MQSYHQELSGVNRNHDPGFDTMVLEFRDFGLLSSVSQGGRWLLLQVWSSRSGVEELNPKP